MSPPSTICITHTLHLCGNGQYAGINVDFTSIKGLKEALDDPSNPVCSNYALDYATKTQRLVKDVQGGEAIFTQPSTPIKCAGAPQKIAYLAEDAWQRSNRRDKFNVSFYSGAVNSFDAY